MLHNRKPLALLPYTVPATARVRTGENNTPARAFPVTQSIVAVHPGRDSADATAAAIVEHDARLSREASILEVVDEFQGARAILGVDCAHSLDVRSDLAWRLCPSKWQCWVEWSLLKELVKGHSCPLGHRVANRNRETYGDGRA